MSHLSPALWSLTAVVSFAALVVALGAFVGPPSTRDVRESAAPLAGGFVVASIVPELPEAGSEIRRFDLGEGGLQIALPSRTGRPVLERVDEIVVRKPVAPYRYAFPRVRRGGWRHLSREVRERIDEGLERTAGVMAWEQIVLHGSSSSSGGRTVLEGRHRQLGLASLAYHFVIGNGNGAPAGAIAVRSRWIDQGSSPAMQSSGARTSVAVCLVGHFHRERVNEDQLEALDELVRYLRAKLGVLPVKPHRTVESEAAACPGRYLTNELITRLNE